MVSCRELPCDQEILKVKKRTFIDNWETKASYEIKLASALWSCLTSTSFMQRSKGSDLFVTGLKRETKGFFFLSVESCGEFVANSSLSNWVSCGDVLKFISWWSFIIKFLEASNFFCQCDLRGLQSPAAPKRQVACHRNCFIFSKQF